MIANCISFGDCELQSTIKPNQWYTAQLKRFIKLHPRKRAKDAWMWLSSCSDVPWKESTLTRKIFPLLHSEYMIGKYKSLPKPSSTTNALESTVPSPHTQQPLPAPCETEPQTAHPSNSTRKRCAKSAADILFAPCHGKNDDDNIEFVIDILNKLSCHIPNAKLRKYKLGAAAHIRYPRRIQNLRCTTTKANYRRCSVAYRSDDDEEAEEGSR